MGQESTCNAGEVSLIPGSGRSPEGGHIATLSSILAQRIPRMEEPDRLQSTELQNSQAPLQ